MKELLEKYADFKTLLKESYHLIKLSAKKGITRYKYLKLYRINKDKRFLQNEWRKKMCNGSWWKLIPWKTSKYNSNFRKYIGGHYPSAVGKDILDKTGNYHLGIIEIPIPILNGNKDFLNDLMEKLYQEEYKDIVVADFSDVAQLYKTYDEYKISRIDSKDINYFGIAIYGSKKQVNKLTGSIGLLR